MDHGEEFLEVGLLVSGDRLLLSNLFILVYVLPLWWIIPHLNGPWTQYNSPINEVDY